MSFINKFLPLLVMCLSFTANADFNVKSIVLNDETTIEAKDISSINLDVNSNAINSVELNDQSVLDGTDIKSIILKKSNNSSGFRKNFQMNSSSASNGNGSGG